VYKLKKALKFVVFSCFIKASYKECHSLVLLTLQKLTHCLSDLEFGEILVYFLYLMKGISHEVEIKLCPKMAHCKKTHKQH